MKEHANCLKRKIIVRIIIGFVLLQLISCETEPPVLSLDLSEPVTFIIDNTESSRTFHAVWSVSSTDAWAGGTYGELYHFENGNWVKHESGVIGTIYDIWGRAADDIYAVCSSAEILHFDGISWSKMDINNTKSLLSIWGDPYGTIFVGGREGITWKYENNAWSKLPGIAPLDSWAIWGVTGEVHPVIEQRINTVYVAGFKGWAVRYGKGAWNFNSYTSIWGVWGSSVQDIYFVGDLGRIVHFDGDKWRFQRTNIRQDLNSVHGNRLGNVFAVGYYGTILHNNGQLWKQIDSETTVELRDVWVTPDNSVFIVGSKGTILRGI